MKEFLEGIDKDISRCDNILKENYYLEIVIGVEELVDKYKDTINDIAMNNDRVWNYSKKDLEIIKEKLISYKKEHIGELVFKSIKANLKENKEISVHKLEEIEEAELQIIEITTDLHASDYASKNITTEYEDKFRAGGKNINYVKFR